MKIKHQNLWFPIFSIIFSISKLASGSDEFAKEKKKEKALAKLPPCSACSVLVKSFEKGLDRTSRGKFEGGDAAWEEKNQGKGYSISEVRFVEIQEKLCTDVDRGESQCHDNHHEWEEHLEEWWALGHDKPNLRKWLCEEKIKACCPAGTFGPKCQPCSKLGLNGLLCSGRGKCKGEGTRKGNGACQCDRGYSGEICDNCGIGFYKADDSDTKKELKCLTCHKACLDQCTGPESKQCLACRKGYLFNTEFGCLDIDECTEATKSKQALCHENEFCVNTEGSYKCSKCDQACQSCHGDGPDSCEVCAEGYVKNDQVCISDKAAGRIFNMTNVRFLTYGGLFIAIAIIFQRSIYIAGVLGLVVAAYISLSEYYLQGSTGELRPVMT